jgi:hypothetical protein
MRPNKRQKWFRGLVLMGLVAAAPLLAQSFSEDEFRWGSRPYTPNPPNAIRVQTRIVQVPVVVRDADGKSVGGLKKSDCELYDCGHQV